MAKFRIVTTEEEKIRAYQKSLWGKTTKELHDLCRQKKIKRTSGKRKGSLIKMLVDHKLNEKSRIREKANKMFDFDEFMGIKEKIPKFTKE